VLLILLVLVVGDLGTDIADCEGIIKFVLVCNCMHKLKAKKKKGIEIEPKCTFVVKMYK